MQKATNGYSAWLGHPAKYSYGGAGLAADAAETNAIDVSATSAAPMKNLR